MTQDDPAAAAARHLHRPGLVVITGAPGAGRSTVLRRLAAAASGPVFTGGGLAMLTAVPALALSRAVRARLPVHDVALLAEAVRSRVRGGLLLLDDLQYADPATLAALPLIAAHCRVAVGLRTPHRLDTAALAGAFWLSVAPLSPAAAADLARRTAPQLDDTRLAAVLRHAGGNPLAVTALARHAATGRGTPGADIDQVAYAIAAALADLPRPARTALAALGLLGRPAPAALLGPGAGDLITAGLALPDGDTLLPVSTYVAETAAGLLDAAARTDLHRRLAELTPPAEAVHHLHAAGDHHGAYRQALTAADRAAGGDRAALLLFACTLPAVPVDPRVRVAAADAALTAGRPRAAARVLSGTTAPLGVEADVLRGEAHVQAGDPAAARAAVTAVPDAAPGPVVAARDRVLLLADLALDPAAAADTADKVTARYPHPPAGVAAALAAVRAWHRGPGWDDDLAAAAAGGDPLTGRWSAWLLVEHLTADARLAESAAVARAAAAACAADLAYSWQTRFAAAADWAEALHGSPPALPAGSPAARWTITGQPVTAPHLKPPPGTHPGPDAGADAVQRRAANLTDRSLPAAARGYATATAALVEADTGLLAAARARLSGAAAHPATDWVAREAAWLDGQPDRAAADVTTGTGLLTGLHHITARWAAHDTGDTTATAIPAGLPAAARRTLTAWATGTGFTAAAGTWTGTALREQVRCLLAAGLLDADAGRAVAALLAAETLADTAGLTVLAGRARRGLRRHHIHRDTRSPRSGSRLTRRESAVLGLVAAGEPTRRIAGQLGISSETVDTHIRAAMRKLGARTRTEAAALALADGEDER